MDRVKALERPWTARWDGLVPDLFFRVVDGGHVRRSRPRGPGSRAAVSAENLVGMIVAVALIVFVIAALLFPERF
jgi:hypothetical protein